MSLFNWKDTKVNFITQWFAKLENLNKLRAPHRPLEYDTFKTQLCQACISSFHLSEQFCKVNDPPEAHDLATFRQNEAKATIELKTTLLLEATRLDSQVSLSQPGSRSSVRIHAHEFSSVDQTYSSMVTDDSDFYSLPIDSDGDFQDYAHQAANCSLADPFQAWYEGMVEYSC
eukprot:jgi/Psemu1/58367/gm1.58367_g